MEPIYWIAIVVIGVLSAYFGAKLIKIKYVIEHDKNIDMSDKIEGLITSILDVVDLGEPIERNIILALDVASEAVDLIGDKSAKAVIARVLQKLEIIPTEAEQKLIDIVVDESLKIVEKGGN